MTEMILTETSVHTHDDKKKKAAISLHCVNVKITMRNENKTINNNKLITRAAMYEYLL